jgi:hypothetical protein
MSEPSSYAHTESPKNLATDVCVKDLGLHGSGVYIILFHHGACLHWQNTLSDSMQSLLLPIHANVDPLLQTVNHVVFDCPRHDAACSANSHFNFDN